MGLKAPLAQTLALGEPQCNALTDGFHLRIFLQSYESLLTSRSNAVNA